MKIIYILTRGDSIGGVQTHVRDLAIELKNRGDDCLVLFGMHDNTTVYLDTLEENKVRYKVLKNMKRPISPLRDIKALWELIRIIKAEKPHVVCTHSSKAGLLGRLAASYAGIPSTFTAHGWAFTNGVSEKKIKLYKLFEKFAGHFSDRVITVSKYDEKLAVINKIVTPKKIVSIHNGVFDNNKYFKPNRKNDTVKLLMVARFHEQKDHKTLFDALKNIDVENWSLDLVGGGELMGHYKALAEKYGFVDKVNFVGEVNNVDDYISEADIFLLISKWEGLPISIIEAMQASLPIIASEVGGVNELIDHASNGYLIDREDSFLLQQRLLTLMKDSTLRKTMGKRSREKYLKQFTFDAMFEKTYAVYKSI